MRHILKLYRPLSAPFPEIQLSNSNISIITFDAAIHKTEWLAFNNAVFAHHPDQGGWQLKDLENRMSEPWFDPAGFFLAIENSKIIACCWTKIHEDLVTQGPIGELYVVGVSPNSSGKGLAKALSIIAMNYFISKNLKQAMLYVDADNVAGVALYSHMGFN